MRHAAALTLAIAALAIPDRTSADGGAAGSSAGPCDPGAASFALGRPFTPELAEEARAAAGATSVRAVPPGLSTTMVFVEDRLTLRLDGDGAVAEVVCG